MTGSNTLLEEMQILHPKLIDLSLDRVIDLLGKLNSPQNSLAPVIHVAGTNGKGSVLAFLSSILEQHGQSVQRFTSPHLISFHERISLSQDGQTKPISEEALVQLLTKVKTLNDGAPITFFEITTVAALLAFADSKADWCLLETGLGGRLDATNVISKPAATIITPIDYDHQKFLGTSLSEIAFEKAGILKPGVTGVIGLQADEALDVIERRAYELGCPLVMRGRDYDVFEQRGRLVYQSSEQLLDLPLPRHLLGRHQIENAGLAITTALVTMKQEIDQAALARGILHAFWPARMQKLNTAEFSSALRAGDELWLDGGHNLAAAKVLAEVVGDLEERRSRPLHLIIGIMANKDVRGFLDQFLGLASQVITVPIDGEEQAMNPDDLADLAVEMGFEADRAHSIEEACEISAAGRHEDARLLICGSLYLAGQILGRTGNSFNEISV